MDNYFNELPPMMSDGRLFTDYRSSQLREELFMQQTGANTANEARLIREMYGGKIIDAEWNKFKNTNYAHPQKKCYHVNPLTRTTTLYNGAELMAYNGELPYV